jgi:hypothetical protein
MNCRLLFSPPFVALVACLTALTIPELSLAQSQNPAKVQEKAQAKAEVQQLQKQVAALKKQRPATIKGIHNTFDRIIKQDKMTKAELDAQRVHLTKERDAQVGMAATPAEKQAVRRHYDSLIGQLGKGERLEQKQIDALQKERRQMVAKVELQYNAAIKNLEARIKELQGVATK